VVPKGDDLGPHHFLYFFSSCDMAAGGDPTLAVHPLTGKSLPYVGVMLEAALSDATKANASRIADPEAATLWEVIRVTTAHARGGRAEVSAGELSAALPAANDTINNYLRALGKASATGGARKRPRRQVEASVDPPAEPEVQGRATGSAKRVRNGSSGPTSGSQPRPAAARPVAAARPASAAREAAGPIEGRTSDDTVRRLRAQEVAYLFNRSNWDGDGDAKFAALLRRPDEDQTWAAEKVLSLTNRGKDVSGFLAHLPQLKAWIASALAGRVYLVIEALCKALVRLDAQSMFAVCEAGWFSCARFASATFSPIVAAVVVLDRRRFPCLSLSVFRFVLLTLTCVFALSPPTLA